MSEEQTVILSPLCASTSRTQHNLAPRLSTSYVSSEHVGKEGKHPVVLKPHVHCFQKKLSYSFIAKKNRSGTHLIIPSSHSPMVLASSRALEFSPFSLGPESLDSFSLRYLPPPWAGLAPGSPGSLFFYNGNGIWDFFGAENKNRSLPCHYHL